MEYKSINIKLDNIDINKLKIDNKKLYKKNKLIIDILNKINKK